MRRFHVFRAADPVAQAVVFSDGAVAMRYFGAGAATLTYPSLEAFVANQIALYPTAEIRWTDADGDREAAA